MGHLYYLFITLNEKMDVIINQISDYKGEIISAIIGAAALFMSVLIGSQTIGRKLSEEQIRNKLQKIEETNSIIGTKIAEILLCIHNESGPLHYKKVEKFYLDYLVPLYRESINSSMVVCTSCYIIERLTNFLLKFRIPHRYIGYKRPHKLALIDNNYFSYISNMLNLALFYTRGSITVPSKLSINKKIVDYIQKTLGGPENNYLQRNLVANLVGVNYDTRFHLYNELFAFIISQSNETVRAFTNIVDDRIIFMMSKYLWEKKLYAPLFLRITSKEDNYPYLFLSGIKYSHPLGNTRLIKMELTYINTRNWFYFEKMITKKLLESDDIEYFDEKLDRKFISQANIIGLSSIEHSIRMDIQIKHSEALFKKNKFHIKNKYKKLHDN